MRIELPELEHPAKLILDRERKLTDDEYFDFCMANPDVRFERTADGEILIVPPAGMESEYQGAGLLTQLTLWADKANRGIVLGSSAEFMLPSGAAYSPYVAFLSNKKLHGLTYEQRTKVPPVAPDFIIEVMSPSDRLKSAQSKMKHWIENGVQLGWLIDGKRKIGWIYRPDQETEQLYELPKLRGEGPVKGFTADLKNVWRGLNF
jgi:Uma2 family endonuclease